MEEFSRELPNLSGTAVRGEAVEECREDGRCQYAIDHGAEGMGQCPEGKCCMPVSARAADAPSEPSRLVLVPQDFIDAVKGPRGELDAWLEVNSEAECRTIFKELLRAADALDSQPTDCEITYLIKGYPGGWWECGKGSYDNAAEGDRKIIYEKSAQASSQPTDGGVRNG